MTLLDDPRALLRHFYDAAVRRALPLHNTAAFLPPPPSRESGGRTLVLGAGKAGGAMAQAVEALWPADAPLSGLVVTRYHHTPPRPQGLAQRIEVVEAGAGTTSSTSAFSLGQPLSAGPYQYYLFKGGVTAGSENNWYLRSSVAAVAPRALPGQPLPSPEPPIAPTPVAAPGTAPLPAPRPHQAIVLYRAEVPVYAAVGRAAALINRSTLDTYHHRQGTQRLQKQDSAVVAGWGRMFGEHVRQHWSGTVSPSLQGSLKGFQAGHDLYASPADSGHRQQAGVYVSQVRFNADVKGFALGFDDNAVGDIRLDGNSAGAYWTLTGAQQWYLDTVLQYTDLHGRARSHRGVTLDLDGHMLAASVETGYPLALGKGWVVEPQFQLIAQKTSFETRNDGISRVSHASQTQWTARLGGRLAGHYLAGGVALAPFVRSNLWRDVGGHDTVEFDARHPITTAQAGTWMDIGIGLDARLNPSMSVFGTLDYSANLDSLQRETAGANIGLRVSW